MLTLANSPSSPLVAIRSVSEFIPRHPQSNYMPTSFAVRRRTIPSHLALAGALSSVGIPNVPGVETWLVALLSWWLQSPYSDYVLLWRGAGVIITLPAPSPGGAFGLFF